MFLPVGAKEDVQTKLLRTIGWLNHPHNRNQMVSFDIPVLYLGESVL
jgi:hypothetical protein